MKFDVVAMNPPYHTRNEGEKKTHPIWHKFVKKAIEICKDDGYLVAVHPAGWRNVEGRFKDTQELLKSKQLINLNMYHFHEGAEIFGCKTDFDWYCLKNAQNNGHLTSIKFQDGSEGQIDISKHEFIPNGSFPDVMKLVAKSGEEKVKIMSGSAYHTQNQDMSKTQDEKHLYPCIYTVKTNNKPTIRYSSFNNKGHFGIPKVIWASGASGVFVDKTGEYGLTPFASAIVDNVENLDKISKALQNEKFIKQIMGFKHSLGDKYNRKVIATFRKDFWKDFI